MRFARDLSLLSSLLAFSPIAAEAAEVQKAVCIDLTLSSNGPNSFINCVRQDGSKILIILAPDNPSFQAGVTNRLQLVTSYLSMVSLKPDIAKTRRLEIDYVNQKPSWSPTFQNFAQTIAIK